MARNRIVRKHIRSPEEVERDRMLRDKYQKQRPSLESLAKSGDYSAPLPQSAVLTLMEFAAAIKAARNTLELSLSEVAELSGIDKAAICRFENGQVENPTFNTLERLAKSVGKRIRIELDDYPKSKN